MTPVINQAMWTSLPNEVRHRIRFTFNIPRSSNTVVSDGKVESDGTTNEDLKSLTIGKMQDFLGTDSTDFHKLFDLTVARMIDELATPKTVNLEVSAQEVPKKRGRQAKNKEHGETKEN